MKGFSKKILGIILAVSLIAASVCAGAPKESEAAKKSIVMNKKKVTLEIGAAFKLKVKKVTPKKLGKAVSYKSAKKKIAKVSKKGKITAVAAGSTKITVTSKKNRKVKTTVKVTVTQAKTDMQQSQTAPAGSTVTTVPTIAPTYAVTPTEASSPRPKRTQKPTATPKPAPTPRFSEPEQTVPPVQSLPLEESSFFNEAPDGTEITYNEDGTMNVKFTTQWAALNFYLPDNAQSYYSNYKSVVVTYKSSHTDHFTGDNNGDLGHALFDINHSKNPDDKEAGKHADWGRKLVTSEEYTTKVFNVTDECIGGCIRGLQIFNPNEMAEGSSITITIKSIIFYDVNKPDNFVPGSEGGTEPSKEYDPALPYTRPLNELVFFNQSPEGTEVTYNEDGTITIDFKIKFATVNFYLPNNESTNNSDYKSIVLTYKSSVNGNFEGDKDGSLCHGLFDAKCNPDAYDSATADVGKHPDWGKTIKPSDEYTTKVFNVTDECIGGCVRGLQIFNTNEMSEGDSITITIKSIAFYNEKKSDDFVPDIEEPTEPPKEYDPLLPYTRPLNELVFFNQSPEGTEVTYNEDGTITIDFKIKFATVNFWLPNNESTNNSDYKSIVLTYKSSVNGNFEGDNDGGLCHGLFDAKCNPDAYDSTTADEGKHSDWGKTIKPSDEYTTKVFNVTDECIGGCVRGLQIFNTNEMSEGDSITITIKSIAFYNEKKSDDFVPDDMKS